MTRAEHHAAEVRRMTRRILAAYDGASAADALAGEAWYAEAMATAEALAAGTDLTVATAAGIIAALSPRQRWSRNVTTAADIIAGRPITGVLLNNARAARRILAGEAPSEVLRGPKVRAFYANIMGDEHEVTVDVWAARAAGHRGTDTFGPAAYRRIAAAYVAAAARRGVTPRTMQATVWVAARGGAA